MLRDVAAPRVAVVERGRPVVSDRLRAALPGATVESFRLVEGLDRLHLALTAGRPWDLMLDVAGGPGTAHRWPELLLQVRVGGSLVVRLPSDTAAVEESVGRVRVAQETHAEAPRPGRDTRGNVERDLAALAASAGDLRIEEGFLLAVNRVPTLAKVPEAEMDEFASARVDARVVATLPGQHVESRCALRASGPVSLPGAFYAPPVSLREYDDAVFVGRQAAYGAGFVAPESYRHPFKRRLRNVAFAEWARRFVREPEPPEDRLTGTYFVADTYVRGHFGHALTDQLGHLWAWPIALRRHPDLHALLYAKPGEGLAPWEYDLLAAAGIEPDRVVVTHGPVRVERLLAASPMFGMPAYAHPELAATYRRIGDALDARSTHTGSRRIFCSRRPGKRTCHNAAEVEALFAGQGFTVLYPEDHPLSEQVGLVRRAEVVAGFAGSGMFQVAFAQEPKHVISVSSESYTASNEYLISALLGHRLDLVLCRPDHPRIGARFSEETYHSDFTYDPVREGRFLRDVLASL